MSGGSSGSIDNLHRSGQTDCISQWDLHSTWENWPMETSAKGGDYHTRLDENGILKISLGILAPTASLQQANSSDDFINVQDSKMWVGPTFDPSSTYRPDDEFCGFASLVADKTPVIGTDFVTNFTTGNGYKSMRTV